MCAIGFPVSEPWVLMAMIQAAPEGSRRADRPLPTLDAPPYAASGLLSAAVGPRTASETAFLGALFSSLSLCPLLAFDKLDCASSLVSCLFNSNNKLKFFFFLFFLVLS